MTFTYQLNPPNDIARVRFHIGDTDSDAVILQDEEITFALDESGTWQAAVISCINAIIAQIARNPKFEADWLSVDRTKALDYYKKLLDEKRRELDVPSITARGRAVWRGDSDATSAPGWND